MRFLLNTLLTVAMLAPSAHQIAEQTRQTIHAAPIKAQTARLTASIRKNDRSFIELALADARADRKPGDPVEPPPPPVLILNLTATPTGESVGLGDLATVTIDPTSTAQGVVWSVVPPPANPANWRPHVPSDPTHANTTDYFADLCNGTQPGTFTVIAAGSLNGQTIIAQQVVTFAAPTPPPPPNPPPGPTPPPDPPPNPPPAPVASKLWIITIDDHTTRTNAQGALLSDGEFWRQVAVAGHKFREYDVSDPTMGPWLAAAKAAGVTPPLVAYQDQASGKLLEVESLPDSEDGIAATIQRLTGKAVGE